jgi:acyl dehydratase
VRYFEDFAAGQTFDLGTRTVNEDEIVAFARDWDPQPFHVDPAAAQDGPFGGLIASGWHSSAILMRLYVDTILHDTAGMGSPGIEELRWLRPVRPGDVLHGRMEILEATPSERNGGRGTLRILLELLNQNGDVALTLTSRGHFARRPS